MKLYLKVFKWKNEIYLQKGQTKKMTVEKVDERN